MGAEPEPRRVRREVDVGLRPLAAGGVLGPVAFVAAWSLLGPTVEGYSPVDDAISRLAAVGAPSRTMMTAGLVVFGVGLCLYAVALRRALAGPAWVAAALAGASALGVAAFPLGQAANGGPHAAFAVTAYAAVAAMPLLAVQPMRASSRWGWARFSLATGLLSSGFLLATAVGPASGLFQRMGLTVADLWIVPSAVDIIRRR